MMYVIRLSDGRYYHKSGSHKKNPWTATLFLSASGALNHIIKKHQYVKNFKLKNQHLFNSIDIVDIRMTVIG